MTLRPLQTLLPHSSGSQEAEELLIGHLFHFPDEMALCYDLKSEDFAFHGNAFRIMQNIITVLLIYQPRY